MKALLSLVAATAALVATPATGQTAEASPLIGSWSVDVSRLPNPPAERPKQVTITFAESGTNRWRTQVEIIDPAGQTHRATSSYTLDGTAAAVEGGVEADVTGVKLAAPNVLVMLLGLRGVPVSTRVYTAAADGRSMTETATYMGSDGKPVLRTAHFTRVP